MYFIFILNYSIFSFNQFIYLYTLDQYIKNGTCNVDIKKIKKGYNVNSIEDCAEICLIESSFDVFNYKCLSFDYCKNPSGEGFICSLYNSTLSSDIDVINPISSPCDHYTSKCFFLYSKS